MMEEIEEKVSSTQIAELAEKEELKFILNEAIKVKDLESFLAIKKDSGFSPDDLTEFYNIVQDAKKGKV